jgi:hypothetical protein
MEKMKKYCDFLGNRIGLKIDSSFHYKSTSGTIFSILLFFFSIAAAINFGLQIFIRDNAKVTLNYEYEDLPYINMTNNFPMALNIVKRGAFPLENFQSYYNISLINYSQNRVNGTAVVKLTERDMKICQEEDFKGRIKQFESIANPSGLSQYFCLKQDQLLELKGMIGTPAVNYMAVLINRCVNGTNIICKSREEIDIQFKNVFIQLLSTDYYFDSKNFSDPGRIYLKSTNIPITSDFYKRTYMYFSNVEYTTDYGLIFEDKITQNYYRTDSMKEQIFFSKEAAFTQNTLSEISITVTPLKYEYYRTYYKLQQLAADVGGIVKAFTLVFTLINNLINEKFLNLKIVNDIFYFKGRKTKNSVENNIESSSNNLNFNKSGNTINLSQVVPINNFINFNSNLRECNLENCEKSPREKKIIRMENYKNKNSKKKKYFLRSICCLKMMNKKSIIKLSEIIINQTLDIRQVIKSINEVQIIKKILFNESQLNAVNYLGKNHFMVKNILEQKNVTFKNPENTLDELEMINIRINNIYENKETLITCEL